MDYGYIRRTGTVVAYYNAAYTRALMLGSKLAMWVGGCRPCRGRGPRRLDRTRRHDPAVFWDPSAGAFQDSEASAAAHPQDANAFAILAGAARESGSSVSALSLGLRLYGG